MYGFLLFFRLKNHAFEQLDAIDQRMVTLEDPLKSSVYGHLKKEIPAFPQYVQRTSIINE